MKMKSTTSSVWAAAAILAVAVVASIHGVETTPDDLNASQSIEIPPDAFYSGRADYPYRSPFAAVRWEEKTPFVLVDEKWYEYVSIDGVEARRIWSFCRARLEKSAAKRFAEDHLVILELLSRNE